MASLEAVTFIKHISKTSGIATPRIFRQILRMEAWQTELLTGQVGRDDTLCLPFQKTPARPWALDLNKCILQFLTSAPLAGVRPADLIGTANEFEENWESWTTTGDRPLYPRPQALSTLSRQLWSLWQDSPLQHFRVAAAANDDMGTVYTQSSLQDAQVSLATAASAWRTVMSTIGLIADGIPDETCVILWRLHTLYVQGGVISPAHNVMLPAMATFTDTLHEQKNVLLLALSNDRTAIDDLLLAATPGLGVLAETIEQAVRVTPAGFTRAVDFPYRISLWTLQQYGLTLEPGLQTLDYDDVTTITVLGPADGTPAVSEGT